MARTQLPPQIRKRSLKTGVRYEVITDAGIDPATGQRRQVRRRFGTEREARDYLTTVTHQAATGQFVPRHTVTVAEVVADFIAARHNLRASSRAKLEYDLAVFTGFYGTKSIQTLTKADIDRMVRSLIDGGSETPTGRKRRAWSPGVVNKVIAAVSRVLEDARRQGLVARNVAEHVDPVARSHKDMLSFTKDEVAQLRKAMDRDPLPPQGVNHRPHRKGEDRPDPADYGDRLAHAWHLALSGLRRGEIAGLRWSDVDLDSDDPALFIRNNRVMAGGQTVEGDPKSPTSRRRLPLPSRLVTVLKAARERQAEEKAAIDGVAGTKDARGYDRTTVYADSGYVVVNEVGEPYDPAVLSRYWRDVLARYGVRHIRLHDARHTCATQMHLDGVPIAVISDWIGHTSAAFTMATYAGHASADDLKGAAMALDKL